MYLYYHKYLLVYDGVMEKNFAKEPQVDLVRKPLEVIENVDFSEDNDRYPEPFASKEETKGFLNGSEGWTLVSHGETIYSRRFVQCGAGLVRNRRSGLVTLIHESKWSPAANTALMLQREDDLDVITIDGPYGGVDYREIQKAHEKGREEDLRYAKRTERQRMARYKTKSGDNRGFLMEKSALIGLRESEIDDRLDRLARSEAVGSTKLVGKIDLPIGKSEFHSWYLLYRPEENIIWIYEAKSKKLFKYKGFAD